MIFTPKIIIILGIITLILIWANLKVRKLLD